MGNHFPYFSRRGRWLITVYLFCVCLVLKYPATANICPLYAKAKKLYLSLMNASQPIIDSLQKIKPELTKKYFVSSIGLFGSVIRDDFSPGTSDVDIIVDFSKPIGIEFIDLAEYLESVIKRKIDLVSRNGIDARHFKEIESQIIYV